MFPLQGCMCTSRVELRLPGRSNGMVQGIADASRAGPESESDEIFVDAGIGGIVW